MTPSEMGKKGAKVRYAKMTAKQRKELAMKANRARWSKARKALTSAQWRAGKEIYK